MRTFLNLVLVVLLTVPAQASAATFFQEESLLVENPMNDDTYAAGGRVMINANAAGDLFVAGGDITVQGAVAEDLLAGGGTVRVKGSVGDDVRIAGGETTIAANVGGDLIVFSGRVFIEDGVTVFGDLIVMGGEVTLGGDVRGDVIVNSGVLYADGITTGSFTFRGAELHLGGRILGNSKIIAESIKLGNGARLDSSVEYWTPTGEVEFGDAARASVTYNELLAPKHPTKHDMEKKAAGFAAFLVGVVAAIATFSLLSSALFIVLILAIKGSYFADAAKLMKKEPWKNMFMGFLYFVCTPMIALFFLITIIGAPIGMSIGGLYLITLMFAKPLSAIVLAKMVELRRKKKKTPMWQTAALSIFMYVVIKVLAMIPILGWIAVLGIVSSAFGAMMRIDYNRFIAAR